VNRLLKTQLKKVYGKTFDVESSSDEFKQFLGLINQAYDDFYIERQVLDNTLEVSSKELTLNIRKTMQSHELLKSVTDSIDDAIFYKDLDLNYIGCNLHFTDFAGKSVQDIIGKNDYDLFDAEEAKHFQGIDNTILHNGTSQAFKEWVSNKEGEKIYLSTVKSPLKDSKGNIIGIVGIARDLTREYQMKKDLETKQLLLIQQGRQASMGEMIGNIAHQWRQPLNALALLVQKIGIYHKRGVLDEEKISTTIDKSMGLINTMSSTIDDFREFFNPNKEKELFSIRDAIEKAQAIVDSAFVSHMIDYALEMPEEIEIEGYKNEFSQVLVNLLNNAKDILIQKGVCPAYIKIYVKKEKGHLHIQVCDNGGGIPDPVIGKIFDPYFTTKPEGKGTGIGLYMSKMIIEDHMKGKLSVLNTDDGACFTIKI